MALLYCLHVHHYLIVRKKLSTVWSTIVILLNSQICLRHYSWDKTQSIYFFGSSHLPKKWRRQELNSDLSLKMPQKVILLKNVCPHPLPLCLSHITINILALLNFLFKNGHSNVTNNHINHHVHLFRRHHTGQSIHYLSSHWVTTYLQRSEHFLLQWIWISQFKLSSSGHLYIRLWVQVWLFTMG